MKTPSAGHDFWPVEKTAELADGPTGYGEVASGGSGVFIFLEIQCGKVCRSWPAV